MNKWMGLGGSGIQKLIEGRFVKEPADYYRLTLDDMVACGIGKANGAQILREIKSSKALTIPQIFGGMAFDNVSEGRIERMIDAGLDTVEKLLNATEAQISKAPGLGLAVARDFHRGLKVRARWIENVIKVIKIEEPTATAEGGTLDGKGFQFTGKMERNRKEMESLAKQNGAKIGWKKGLENILVMNPGARAGSKAKKAEANGYKIISESEFLSLINT